MFVFWWEAGRHQYPSTLPNLAAGWCTALRPVSTTGFETISTGSPRETQFNRGQPFAAASDHTLLDAGSLLNRVSESSKLNSLL